MTNLDLPSLPDDLKALFAAERPVPAISEAVKARVAAQLASRIGRGGAGGLGGKALLALFGATIVIGGGALYRRSHDAVPPSPQERAPKEMRFAQGHPSDEDALPAWFGNGARPVEDLAGVVVRDGVPVAGARVILTNNATRAGLVADTVTQTDAQGHFDLGSHRADVYDVTAAADGNDEGFVRVDTRDPVAVPDPRALVITLPGCANSVFGVVRDAAGGVVAGATITRARGEAADISPIGAGVTSGQDGAYQLCVPAGPMSAVVRAQSYGSVTLIDSVLGRVQKNVVLVPESTVVGRVVRADTGEPVPRAVVWLAPGVWSGRERTTSEITAADDAGEFRITGVAPGRHYLYSDTDTLHCTSVPVTVAPGEESSEVVLRLEARHVHLHGHVLDGDAAVPGAIVRVSLAGGATGESEPAASDGAFDLWLDRPGPAAVEVAGYDVSPASLDVADQNADVLLHVTHRATIAGTVTRHGHPVAGAEVGALGKGTPTTRTTTDASGVFALVGLPAGSYRLYGVSWGTGAVSIDADSPRVEVAAGQRRDGVVIELDGAASISGQVRDQNDQPVARVSVQYVDAKTGDLCRDNTDNGGRFSCTMLAGSATYAPTVRADATSANAFAEAAPGGLGAVDVKTGDSQIDGVVLHVRAARAPISGRVITNDGQPAAYVLVRAIESSTALTPATAPWVALRSATTDGNGGFSIDTWSGETYAVQARAPAGGDAIADTVAAGTSDLVLRLQEPGRIHGTLAGFASPPRVWVRSIGGPIDNMRADVDGVSYSATGLSPGAFAVMAMSGTQAAAERVVVAAGTDAVLDLEARPAARVSGRVIDFVTDAPVAGVTCAVAPYVDGASVEGLGLTADPTDADGAFAREVPSGSIAFGCATQSRKQSGGRAWLDIDPGAVAGVVIPVVVGDSVGAGSSVGIRILDTRQDQGRGFVHTVAELRPHGAAESAGIKVGDVITLIDGKDVSVLDDQGVYAFIGRSTVGSPVHVTLRRGSVSKSIDVVAEGPWWSSASTSP